jgi:hypothetical protein
MPLRSRLRVACAAVLCAALASPAAAADLAAPGGWRKETFAFPLPYTPTLPYEGTEQVRFSPGWSRFATEEGFSYVVLWDIKPAAMEPEALERALGVYFDGLMNNVAIGRKLEAMVPQSSATLHPMAAPEGWSDAYAGRIFTWNAFAAAEPLTLNLEVTVRKCGAERVQVFYAIAKAARSSPVWAPMRSIRQSASCAS